MVWRQFSDGSAMPVRALSPTHSHTFVRIVEGSPMTEIHAHAHDTSVDQVHEHAH